MLPLHHRDTFGGIYRTRTDQARILQGFSGCPAHTPNLVRVEGFEPPTLPPQTECASQTALHTENILVTKSSVIISL